MLERIRRGTQSGLSYILVGVLIVFFAVFFGVPADGCRAGDGQRVLMASVDGDDIYTEDVNAIYYRYFGGQRSGTTQDDEFFSQQAEALRVVITTYLLAQRAQDAGLRVSDEEFAKYITDPNRNIEFLSTYGRTGQFDGPFYERYVQHGLRVPIPSYEAFKRKELLARKYLVMLDMQAHVTPDEIEELNQLRNTKVSLAYIEFTEDSLIDIIGLDDEDVTNFLADDTNRSRIEEYLDEHRSDYEQPERVELRNVRIFKPSDDQASDEATEAQENFEEARRRIVDEGEDFATVATELSEDFYRDDGGLMGWNTLDNVDQDIVPAIEDADVGDVREIETDHAYILVKVEDREDETTAELADVEEEIAESLLRRDLVETRGVELAETLHAKLAEGLSFEEALEQLEEEAREEERDADAEIWAGLSPSTTGLFNLEGEQVPQQFQGAFDFGRAWDDIPQLGQHRELAIAAFKLTEDNPLYGEIVELDNSRAVVRLDEREDPPEDLSSSDRAELELEARAEKVNELLGAWQFFFTRPTEDYGHYINSVFQTAIDDGDVRLYERNSRAAALVRQMAETGEASPGEDALDGADLFEGEAIDLDDLDIDSDGEEPAE